MKKCITPLFQETFQHCLGYQIIYYLLRYTQNRNLFQEVIISVRKLLATAVMHQRVPRALLSHSYWVLFENRPALYFFNYTFISAYKIYFFYSVSKILFRIFCLCYWISLPIMIVKMKIFLHTVYSSILSIKSSINKSSYKIITLASVYWHRSDNWPANRSFWSFFPPLHGVTRGQTRTGLYSWGNGGWHDLSSRVKPGAQISYPCLDAAIAGSCLKTGQHSIFVIIYLLLLINCIILDSVSKILFHFFIANNNNNDNNENIAP